MAFRIINKLINKLTERRRRDESGQTTAEYALVLVGAATVAVLLLTWATGSGRIAWLLDEMIDTISGMIS
ncbi:MAG: DUF4244 domain-containing protein [Acidimicrobiaceae bacterium]|nr:DUF4244 domain-containing protein [Acidimicrobiaceae bacterium]MCY4175829.1 DUF4244 domain-containing protein [Acidimicrobiaceae bacterium]MCY4280932.1 DUF4244 domain-containing protein [Acidimicrobiaceae bacterium]MCY4294794.1 DUF4244 domain-containing protein [Acidimicrobiaceae bacterium]